MCPASLSLVLNSAINITVALLAHSVDRGSIRVETQRILLPLLDLHPLLGRSWPDATRDSRLLIVICLCRVMMVHGSWSTALLVCLPGG